MSARLLAVATGIARRSWLGVLFTGVLTASSAGQPPVRHPMIDLADFRITFDEPFDHLDVSATGSGTRWSAHTPWDGDFGDARFIDPTPQRPFAVKNGMLGITMSRSNGRWESGLLASANAQGAGFLQSGGYFEMRARLPPGPGVWPAFWLGVRGKSGETVPEVDIIEYYGKFPSSYRATVHLWRDGNGLYAKSSLIDVSENSLSSAFHTYGVSIDPDFIVFYLDRREVSRVVSGPEYLHPMCILLNLAAGSGWPTNEMHDPSVMTVDYVRAYQKRSDRVGAANH